MTQEEKEHLANRIVAVLRSEDPHACLDDLDNKVKAGDEGDDGLNSVVLAVAAAMVDHLKRGR